MAEEVSVEIVFPGFDRKSNPEIDKRMKALEESLRVEIEKAIEEEERGQDGNAAVC